MKGFKRKLNEDITPCPDFFFFATQAGSRNPNVMYCQWEMMQMIQFCGHLSGSSMCVFFLTISILSFYYGACVKIKKAESYLHCLTSIMRDIWIIRNILYTSKLFNPSSMTNNCLDFAFGTILCLNVGLIFEQLDTLWACFIVLLVKLVWKTKIQLFYMQYM